MHSAWGCTSQTPWVHSISHVELAPMWVLIRANFDPIYNRAKHRRLALFCETTVHVRTYSVHSYMNTYKLSFRSVNLFGISPYRIQWTQGQHVEALEGSSHSTRSVSRLGLLWLLRMWTLPGAQLGGVTTPLSHPQILPQAMTVCQWLLRMWWEWELQEDVQHNSSVSWVSLCYPYIRVYWLIDVCMYVYMWYG